MHVETGSALMPALGFHVHLEAREGMIVRLRMSREPGDPPCGGVIAYAVDRLARHLSTGREDLSDVPVDLSALPEFQRRALAVVREIPPGRTLTYGEVARLAGGGPGAARAVGGAMAANPIPLLVPCHRVVPAEGAPFRNYSGLGGVATKRALLRLEGAAPQEGLERWGAGN